ncbi:MAG: hypothetical protein IT449_00165 [Phycisphaerales bacterium]|nr:hypothetical protein [Phycisphaerales bacterium]
MNREHDGRLHAVIGRAAKEHWVWLDLSIKELGFPLGRSGAAILATHLRDLQAVTSLHLNGAAIGPDGICTLLAESRHLAGLTYLSVDDCALGGPGFTLLGSHLPSFPKLELLGLSRNGSGAAGVRALGAHLRSAGVPSLRFLDLSENAIGDQGTDELAVIASGAGGLRELLLRRNGITAHGAKALAAAHWPELTLLILEDNRIGDAGAATLGTSDGIPKLRDLWLSGNDIGSAGAEVLASARARWTMLSHLDLSYNRIDNAGALALMSAACKEPWASVLVSLGLVGNPIDVLPAEVLQSGGVRELRSYAEDLARGESRLYALKVMLLGEGRTGKTHLRHRLFGHDVKYHNPGELQTHDIAMRRWIAFVDIADDRYPLSVNVLDCGGQGHLHSSHRLFLSDRRSLFLIVCDATRTRAENRLDYWLGFVRHEASAKCPIIVAVTKCDLFDDSGGARVARQLEVLDGSELRHSVGLPDTTPLVVIDDIGWCGTLSGDGDEGAERHRQAIMELLRTVERLIPCVPDLTTRYPISLARLVDWLRVAGFDSPEHAKVGWITGDDFREACRRCSVPDGLSEVALEIAHNLGCVHCAGAMRKLRRGESLAEIVFNPEWVRTPVYRIIRAGDEVGGRGMMTWAQIETILPEHGADPTGATLWERLPFTASDRVKVIDLMRVCGLIFEMPRGLNTPQYFVPDHLAGRGVLGAPPGDYVWKREFEWLAESAFSRLLGRLRQQVVRDPVAVWRDEITVAVGKRARMTVRLVAADMHMAARGCERTVSTVFVAFTSCTENEAMRLLGLVDSTLRAILEEDAISPLEWEPVGHDTAKASSDMEVTIPEYAEYAARVYDAVKQVEDGGACRVRSWPELLVWAAEIVRLRDEQGEPDFALAAAVKEARADVERFARYCREARRRSWWSSRGKRKVSRSAADWATEDRRHSTGDREE